MSSQELLSVETSEKLTKGLEEHSGTLTLQPAAQRYHQHIIIIMDTEQTGEVGNEKERKEEKEGKEGKEGGGGGWGGGGGKIPTGKIQSGKDWTTGTVQLASARNC